jgi:outer membrane protein
VSGCPAVFSAERGDWIVRVGGHYVDPQSDDNDLVEVEGATSVTFDVTYMLDRKWGVELLGAIPFGHDISLVDGPKVATTEQLPPTLSVVYNFLPEGRVRPYVGVGVNWTIFFDEATSEPLNGTDLSLDQSVGAAGLVGLDITIRDNWFFNANVRYMDIETDATAHLPNNGGTLDVGSVQIDPWAFAFALGRVF